MASYDILIKSGGILDGEKNEPFQADIGVTGDKISAVGDLKGAEAGLTIDASGKYVTPGFIDITNHSDTHLTLFKYPAQESLLMQGVTSAVGGNCGASLAPLASKEAIGAIKKWADPSQINTDWSSVGEYLEALERLRPGVNFGTFTGYGTLRRGVIGDNVRPLTPEERARVKFLLGEGMKEGALGFSLGLSYGHERVSTTEEIVDVAGVLSPSTSSGNKKGIIKIHLRSEGKDLLGSVNEAVRIGRGTGAPVQISHLKAIGRKAWKELPKVLELIENARASGLDINYDVSPYLTTGSPLYSLIPAWARSGGFGELFKRLENPEDRRKILEDLEKHTLHFDKILVISAKHATYPGHTLAELAEEGGISPEEALLDTVRSNEGRVFILGRTLHPQNTELEIKNQNSHIASDGEGYSQEAFREGGLTHPRSFGAFPHFWHKYVRDKGLVSPAEAIKKITSGPADKLGIESRGRIKKGNFADIAVFDPAIFRDKATYKNPFRYPAGIEWVLVNGKAAVERGRPMGVRTGRTLKA